LKEEYGTKIVAVEALECPTMLENGYGEHNIQGIGDKHIPLIHNVMNTDVVVGISDRATDELDVLFNTPAGRAYLARKRGIDERIVGALEHFGFSSVCNVLAAIKTAKLLGLGPDDAIVTVATDGAAMYPSERDKTIATRFGGDFDDVSAGEVFGEHLANVATTRSSSAPSATGHASSTSATTPGSSSRARRSSCSKRGGRRSSGAGCAGTSRCGTT
jgi:hypothetical protein